MGLKTIAVDTNEKKDFCLSLGATAFLACTDTNLIQAVKDTTIGRVAGVIATAGSQQSYEQVSQVCINTD